MTIYIADKDGSELEVYVNISPMEPRTRHHPGVDPEMEIISVYKDGKELEHCDLTDEEIIYWCWQHINF